MKQIFSALGDVLRDHPEAEVIFPVHKNPLVRDIAKEKLGDLVSMQLSEGTKWHIVTNDVTGYGDWQRCYTSGYSVELSVLWPDEDTVEQAKQRIKACYDGETVK